MASFLLLKQAHGISRHGSVNQKALMGSDR
jgi:hypothetical protein